MKLTEVSIDGYGVCNNLRLQGFDHGLNVVVARPGSGSATLVQYIRNVLFGFGNERELGHGALEFSTNGSGCRLMRTVGTQGQLVVSDLQGSRDAFDPGAAVESNLSALGADVFDTVYLGANNRDSGDLARIANLRCHVPFGRDAVLGNAAEVARQESQVLDCQRRMGTVESRISELEFRRQQLNQRIDELEISSSGQVHEVENELRRIEEQLQGISVSGIKTQIQTLDHEISDLQNRVEAGQRADSIRTVRDDSGLSDWYQRLDDVDDQIRRWRQIHSDIQQQRVQLKNEMVVWNETGIESEKHPYHRAQEIVTAIESKVGMAEQSVGALQNVQIVTPENNAMAAERLSEICNGIRKDLYELCDELSGQFKQIRHRAAAAELKRLRRCYEEVGENIQVLVNRREHYVVQIRRLDPEGARLIDRQDHAFCQCAMHDGYLQARRRFAGPLDSEVSTVETPSNRFEFELARISELRSIRSQRVSELVDFENQITRLEARRLELRQLLDRYSDRGEMNELQEQFRQLQVELTAFQQQRQTLAAELQQLRNVPMVPANSLLQTASQLLERLTENALNQVWLEDVPSPDQRIAVAEFNGTTRTFNSLVPEQQAAVCLSLRLAMLQYFGRQGIQLPMILQHQTIELNDSRLETLFDLLMECCRQGDQVLLITDNRVAAEISRRRQVVTLDLPETSVSPVGPFAPVWRPDRNDGDPPREPEFLTPYTTRMHRDLQPDMNRYPQVKYPPAGARFEHQSLYFESTTAKTSEFEPVAEPNMIPASVLSEQAPLSKLGVFDSMDVERLERLGVSTVSQLMEVNPNELPVDFADAHISSNQMDQWQALSWLMICVPGLTATDARILYAIGVIEPEQLENTNSTQLIDRINRFLRSADGQAFATVNRSYDRNLANRWYQGLSQTRSRWRMPSGYSRRRRYSTSARSRSDRETSRHLGPRPTIRVERERERISNRRNRRDWRPEREPRVYDKSAQKQEAAPTIARSFASRSNESESSVKSSSLKFYLELSDDLEAAPSIGPKTAERFAKINVRTIADFLKQTAESMATKIKYKRITADVIRQWQHQARFVCRVPNLRGHDAQLLVACGITEPEDLAERQPQSLFKIIEPFAKSKDGLKIIRGGKQPDLEEVSNWISWARETRSLQAA